MELRMEGGMMGIAGIYCEPENIERHIELDSDGMVYCQHCYREAKERIKQLEESCIESDKAVVKLMAECERLEAENKQLIYIFRHYHVYNGIDDACKDCGLDLRNDIHITVSKLLDE